MRSEPATPPPEGDGSHLRLIFEVEDSGPGIAKEDLAHIFEPFAQAETGAMAEGAGLGMAISRGLAEVMGGKLTVESEVGKGSCFRLNVPVDRADGAAAQQGADTLRAPAVAPASPETPALTPESVAALPAELRRAMREAVADGDMALLAQLVGQAHTTDPAAAAGLKALADRYDYGNLDKLLADGGRDNG